MLWITFLLSTYYEYSLALCLRHVHVWGLSDVYIPRKKNLTIHLWNYVKLKGFVRKARTKSSPGINGISYKLYKRCSKILAFLWKLLREAYTKKLIAENWGLADGIHIPKEKDSRKIDQFQPISLLNVEGKIFFGVIAKRMTRFVINNGYANTSIQKAGVPGFPLCCGIE